jgi:acetolactate synthase-1/2/3 large subunit
LKLSDFIAQFLHQEGIRHVFVVSGGAIIHTIDSVARHPQMSYVCVQHEQAAGAAADAYWRTSGKVGTVMVTSGPGATNLTTSICNAFFDSVPILCICGQVTTPRLRPNNKLRQKGFQETDIVSLFGSITKYVHRLTDPLDIKYELQKALYIARSGRPGPVALDIPDDLQRRDIDVSRLKEFVPQPRPRPKDNTKDIRTLVSWIKSAKRPLVIYGAGIRIAGAIDPALDFIRKWGLPTVLTWGGKDIMTYDDPLNMGGLGVVGPRWGNFAAQNSDLIIAVGTRLSQMVTGGKTVLFAPNAKKVLIDIDPYELSKFTSNDFQVDLGIESELFPFFKSVADAADESVPADSFASWRARIKSWEKEYPICPVQKYQRRDYVDGHVFVKMISKLSRPGDIFIADTGANISWVLQAIEMKEGQRIFSAWNHTPMGYALSASVGAAFAAKQRIICLTGDGGLMMNIQEMATVRRHNLDVKLFIFNNGGHAIQKQTMDTWLNSNYAAVDEKSGLSFPDFVKTAEAFHLPAMRASNHDELESVINRALAAPGPVLCDIIIDPNQKIEPMLKFGSGLEDLAPKLPDEEIAKIMSVSSGTSRATSKTYARN